MKKLGRSISAHVAGPENVKYTNASKIRVTKAKISIANGTGSCVIYVYAQNGISAKVKVTVR